VFLIDESFLMFKGEDWRLSSAMSLIEDFPDRLIVIVSLTKIWSCPGLRIGAVVASDEWIDRIAKHQVPWSCNVMAQAFIEHACRDVQYLAATWSTIPVWKNHIHDLVHKGGWSFNDSSPLWAPWVFMSCGSDKEAEELCTLATVVGIPVRWCKSHGIPCYLRIGIRAPETMNILFNYWMANAKRIDRE
jgi:histidinol-phosphate/aromatic aminotransferase/cobyric acid decarboxylase-like protein